MSESKKSPCEVEARRVTNVDHGTSGLEGITESAVQERREEVADPLETVRSAVQRAIDGIAQEEPTAL